MKKIHLLVSSFFLCFNSKMILAHEGHLHTSTPSATSSAGFIDLANTVESPLTFSFKTRLGYEDEQYFAIQPGIYSFFGDDQISTNLSFEYRFRNYSNQFQSNASDYNNNYKVSANIKKSLSESFKITALGEHEQNRANVAQKYMDNYNYNSVGILVLKIINRDSNVSMGYQHSARNFPNGTYSIPISHQTLIGEPISFVESTPTADELIKYGVEDAEHDITVSGSTAYGAKSLSLEARYALNYSNFKTRQYQAQALKVGIDSPLWKKATLFLSQSIEFRNYSVSKQNLLASELHLIQEIDSKLSLLGLARYNQIETLAARDWWEGYAQLQFIF